MKHIFFVFGFLILLSTVSSGQTCSCDRKYPLSHWDGTQWIENELWISVYDSTKAIDTIMVEDYHCKYEIATSDCSGSAIITEYDSTGVITGKFVFMQGVEMLKEQIQAFDPFTGDIAGYVVCCYFQGILIEYSLYSTDGTMYHHWKDDLKWMENQ